MSSSPTPHAPAHPTTGGKSLASYSRPRYKSWRKKYRKMRVRFDAALDENRRVFKEEKKLKGIASRLREEVDELLELSLLLNTSPALPPHLRYNITPAIPLRKPAVQSILPPDITPEDANRLFADYNAHVRQGLIPPLDLHVVRQQIDERLASQDAVPLGWLEERLPQPVMDEIKEDEEVDVGYLTSEQEDAYLRRLDAQLTVPYRMNSTYGSERDQEEPARDEASAAGNGNTLSAPHWADLTPREWERHVELLNPQSQHNWLKKHLKSNLTTTLEGEDNESIASHPDRPSNKRKAGAGGKSNLAKQIAERAAATAAGGSGGRTGSRDDGRGGTGEGGAGYDSQSVVSDDDIPPEGKRKGRDPDATYRLKGSAKGKRKRSVEDSLEGKGKKAKVEGE